ncbi:MAG: 4'-phosphopantetheinyl transferase superfamily protein [Nodosilinea sp.]
MTDLGHAPPSSSPSAAVDLYLITTKTAEAEIDVLDALQSALSPDELARLQRLHRPAVWRQYILSRGCLRHLLSRYTGQAPNALTFAYGPYGKPSLGPNRPGVTPVFNLSHSGARLLIGVSSAPMVTTVGVDIEVMRSVHCLSGLCRRCLTPAEAQTVLALPPPQADYRFLAYWTGKEAWLKAQGLGIADSMQGLELGLKPEALPAKISAATIIHPTGSHQVLYQWQPEADYLAAIALQADRPAQLRFQLQQMTPLELLANPLP